MIGAGSTGLHMPYGAVPCCLDRSVALNSSNLSKVLGHDDRDNQRG
jgi:hypothetical protein